MGNVDERTYDSFKGADWPPYTAFITNDFVVNDAIKKELDAFSKMMKQKYISISSPNTQELSKANQQRQKQIFFNKRAAPIAHCNVPWDTLGINSNGNVFICESPSWLPIFVGDILDTDDIYDILNSESAQKIRQEILEKRYLYCNDKICGFFNRIGNDYFNPDITDTEPLTFVTNDKLLVTEIPKNIIFDFDYTCNFKCPSCRMEVINWNDDTIVKPINDRIVEKIKRQVIDRIGDQPITIRWAGGEPFMSEAYIDLFDYIIRSSKKNIQSIIQTNGSLLQQKQILVKQLLPYIKELRISFDAGTEETYKKIRVNGSWNKLVDNVFWVKDVITTGKYTTKLTADFVVQRDNYKEIPEFVSLCKQIGVDNINLQRMWNWGTWDNAEFDEKNIYNPLHPEYEELKKYFKLAGQTIAET